jgi:glycosyltransferase involved in cell wall biosynthesis
MRAFLRRGIPVCFRGDSHLLDQHRDWRWQIKRALLRRVYGWTSACLYVGRNNFEYYRELGVPPEKLFYCPHSIEVERFAEPNDELERQARQWRGQLQILDNKKVLLFAGKFETRKQPVELMNAMKGFDDDRVVLLMVGNGPLEEKVCSIARDNPERFKVLPFQNQSRMPVVYRLADLFVLPSLHGETWGLALNEALACGRRVIASDKVGGAPDLISSQVEGAIFKTGDWNDFRDKVHQLLAIRAEPDTLRQSALRFDVSETERTLVEAVTTLLGMKNHFAPGTVCGNNGG